MRKEWKYLERYLKCCRMGRRMGFLIKMQHTCTQICSLTAVRSTFGKSFTFSASGSPAPQRESLWFLSPTFHAYFAMWHFFWCAGRYCCEAPSTDRGLSEVQFSEVVCWWHRFKDSISHPISLSLPVYCNSLPCQFHSEFFWKMLKADWETYLVKNKSPLTNTISHSGQCANKYSVVPSTDPSTSKWAVRHSTGVGTKTLGFLKLV